MHPVRAASLAIALSWVSPAGQLLAGTSVDLSTVRRVDSATPRDVQIALALAAGPPVSQGAAVYILGAAGYVKAREGTNGFTCLVERSRVDAIAPTCFDAEGSATTVKVLLFREEQRALGKDDARIASEIEEGYKTGRFLAPRKPGVAYMLSENNYLVNPESNRIFHFPGHVMFHAPYMTAKDIGTGPDAPDLTEPGRPGNMLVVIPARSHEEHQP
jgi:hypothetical protein